MITSTLLHHLEMLRDTILQECDRAPPLCG